MALYYSKARGLPTLLRYMHHLCAAAAAAAVAQTNNHFQLEVKINEPFSHDSLFAEIYALCNHGELDRAIRALSHIIHLGVFPPGKLFFTFLQACHHTQSLLLVLTLQIYMALYQLDTSLFLGDYLVSILAASGAPDDALRTLFRLPHGSVYSWTSLITAYTDSGRYEDGMAVYWRMIEDGVEPNAYTFVSLLKACSDTCNLMEGMHLNNDAERLGFTSDVHVGTALISMYGKCWCMTEAKNVFDRLQGHDPISWNALLSVYTELNDGERALQGYNHMKESEVSANKQTCLIALRACCACAEKEVGAMFAGELLKLESLESGRTIHTEAEKLGFASDVFLCSTLVSMYGKCGSVFEAEAMYASLSWHDVVSGSAMLSAFLEQGQAEKILQLYRQMTDLDEQMIVVGLQACCLLAAGSEGQSVSLEIGRTIHANCIRKGLLGIFVGSALVTMYGKGQSIQEAEHVFIGLTHRDVVLFNAMLAAYVEQGKGERALQLYRQMHVEGVSPDERTLVRVLQACCKFAEKEEPSVSDDGLFRGIALEIGQALHADARQRGFDKDSFVGNTLVCMYGMCWNIAESEKVFAALSRHDCVSWNAMLSAYMEQEQEEKALQLYKQMQEKCATVDDTTLSCILQACCERGTVKICRHVHHSIICARYDGIVLLASGLIRAYTSCASMEEAQAVFDGLDGPDVGVWTSLIAGYAQQGDSVSSFTKYKQMRSAGIKPNNVTYLSIFSACGHSNLVDTAVDYFLLMTKNDALVPTIEHYNSILDLLGRAGDFIRVKDILSIMLVEPDLITWMCLLTACLKHGNVELGKEFFQSAVRVQPAHAAAYVLMSNIYTNAGLLDSAREINNLRQKNAAWKKSGWTVLD